MARDRLSAAIPRTPRTLTELEQATLVKVTGEHRDCFRDHVMFAVALGAACASTRPPPSMSVTCCMKTVARRRIELRTFRRSSTERRRRSSRTAIVYDVFGRLWKHRQERAPLAQGDQRPKDWLVWDFKYDAGDRLRKVERAGHEVTVQDWDGQGRLAAIHTLFNGTETRAWGFDADGLDVEVRDSTALSIMSDDRRRGTLELAGKMTARAR